MAILRESQTSTYNTTTSTNNTTIGWDGDDVLFQNGAINIEKLGAVVAATGSTGTVDMFAVYDRDWTGALASEHELYGFAGVQTSPWRPTCNATGSGLMHICTYAQRPGQGGPSDPSFSSFISTPLSAGRSDGYSDGVNVFQGVRAYDPNMNQWTTPDAYSGDVHDPMSQKPYMWNGNNPVQYADPSGYDWAPITNPAIAKVVATIVNGSAVARAIYNAIANDHTRTVTFRVGPLSSGGRGAETSPGSGNVAVSDKSSQGTPYKVAQVVDMVAHEFGHIQQVHEGTLSSYGDVKLDPNDPKSQGAGNFAEFDASRTHDEIMKQLDASGYQPDWTTPVEGDMQTSSDTSGVPSAQKPGGPPQ